MTKTVRKLVLKFDGGSAVGSWDIPDPNDPDPQIAKEFIRISSDVGWHICYGIATGEKGCQFLFEDDEISESHESA